jgi:hypothetical protein
MRQVQKLKIHGIVLIVRETNTVEIKIMETQKLSFEKPFEKAHQKFEQLCERLESALSLAMTHGQLERYIHTEGTEVMRQIYQDHLELRSIKEEAVEAVIGPDRVKRVSKRSQKRLLETIFGTVVVSRYGYGKKGKASVHPLDMALNLPKEKYSHGLGRMVAQESGKGSYDEAIEAVERYSGGHVPKKQAEELVIRSAVDFKDLCRY